MRGLIAALLFLVATASAAADSFVGSFQHLKFRLDTTPCTSKVILEKIRPEYHDSFMGGVVVENGKETQLCWVPQPPYVFVVDESGESGFLDVSDFKRAMHVKS
jgi:hypothetical protein